MRNFLLDRKIKRYNYFRSIHILGENAFDGTQRRNIQTLKYWLKNEKTKHNETKF